MKMVLKLISISNMKYKTLFSLPLIALLLGCTNTNPVVDQRVFSFDTYINIRLYEGKKTDGEYLEELIAKYDKLSDNYQNRDISNVYTINHTNDDVTISEELYKLLKTSFDVTKEGATYFNPLCGSLAKRWKEALKNKQILDETIKNEELLKMQNTTLTFKENNVVQLLGDAEIDLGGIAKGYVLDRALDYLKEQKINSYLINGGSSSILLGEKKSKDGLFSVGLNDIEGAYIKLKNCFVSTSSKSVQGVEIDGVTYSHIINPKDGSALNENDAVIVISETGYYGDAMSTSMMMNTIDEIKTIEKEHNLKTIVIKSNKIVYSHPDIEVLHR